jgi:hypothetical protein
MIRLALAILALAQPGEPFVWRAEFMDRPSMVVYIRTYPADADPAAIRAGLGADPDNVLRSITLGLRPRPAPPE